MQKSKPGVWESVVLLEDGSLDVEWMTIFDDGSAMHGDAIYQPGDGKFEDVMTRHPNLQVGVVHKVQIPHEGKLEPLIDQNNVIEIKLD